MKKENILKALGIIIVVVLALSMLAVALYANDDDNSSTDTTINNNPIVSTFTYDISFDTNVLKELNAIRLVADTTSLDKQAIDIAVQKISGISSVNSQFRSAGENTWYYFAEITLKKSASIQETIDSIFALSYFDGETKEAMKYVTINAPGKITLNNTELNVTRDFVFESTTLSALVSLDSQPSDKINVSGTIKLQGQNVLALELIEQSNISNQPISNTAEISLPLDSVETEMFFDGTTSETIDENALREQLLAIDENAQIYFSTEENTKTLSGNSKISYLNEIKNLLENNNFSVNFVQIGNFSLNELYLADLNQTLPYSTGTIQAEINTGHTVGDIVPLELTAYTQSEQIIYIQGKEK